MRLRDLVESYTSDRGIRYDSNPSYYIGYEEPEDDDGNKFPIWVNPSPNTFFKLVTLHNPRNGEARGLIYKTGEVLIWEQPNLYHSDVYNQIGLGPNFILCQFTKKDILVKGGESSHVEKPLPDDNEWVRIVRQNKFISRYYGPNVILAEINWW